MYSVEGPPNPCYLAPLLPPGPGTLALHQLPLSQIETCKRHALAHAAVASTYEISALNMI